MSNVHNATITPQSAIIEPPRPGLAGGLRARAHHEPRNRSGSSSPRVRTASKLQSGSCTGGQLPCGPR
eukprot:5257225-Alexandrium_andersonii.AAC.1